MKEIYQNTIIDDVKPYYIMYNGQRYNAAYFGDELMFGNVPIPDEKEYFNITVTKAGRLSFGYSNIVTAYAAQKKLYYSYDKITWYEKSWSYYNDEYIDLHVGDVVYFKGDNSGTLSTSSSYGQAHLDGWCYFYAPVAEFSCNGNLLSFLRDDFVYIKTVTAWAFYRLFSTNKGMDPTVGTRTVYSGVGINNAPILYGDIFMQTCYGEIFAGCTNIDSITIMGNEFRDQSLRKIVYEGSETGALYVKGGMIPDVQAGYANLPSGWNVVEISEAPTYETEPFYIEMGEGTITIKKNNDSAVDNWLEYSYDAENWIYLGRTTTNGLSISNDSWRKIYIRSLHSFGRFSDNDSYYNIISCSNYFTIGGNIMSLIYKYYDSYNSFTSNYTFNSLFINSDKLYDARDLLLPNTTRQNCYQYMFSLCTHSAFKAPVLRAETLANQCYKGMFGGVGYLKEIHCYAKNWDDNATPFLYWINGAGRYYTNNKVYIPIGYTQKYEILKTTDQWYGNNIWSLVEE